MTSVKNQYYLLLIDIKDSSSVPAESMNKKMKELEAGLKIINKQFKAHQALPLSISYGDEIAGLFHTPDDFYSIVKAIRKILYPFNEIRFAATKGRVAMETNDIRKIGGSIFKIASEAIARLKSDKGYAAWSTSDLIKNISLTSLCQISNSVVNKMSPYQREVYELLSSGHTQKEIGRTLGKYTQSVWDAIQRSDANYVIEAEKTINLILSSKSEPLPIKK